ncbi:hypothetical protein LTR67_004462 [Exophiala xenobiotica]
MASATTTYYTDRKKRMRHFSNITMMSDVRNSHRVLRKGTDAEHDLLVAPVERDDSSDATVDPDPEDLGGG